MHEHNWLAERFEENRGHLRGVAYRMLGSLSEAEDAIQETWLRLSRSDAGEIENLGGWLTTVVARVCLDMLRSRTSRREEALGAQVSGPAADPEREALLADSVGLALLVMLDRLAPAERVAFVMHDLFAVPFEDIGPIVGRTPAAARQLASRARRRVQGAGRVDGAGLAGRRQIVESFLAALRSGDVERLVALLHPELVVRVDAAAGAGAAREVHGARNWATGAVTYAQALRSAETALVDGEVGVVVGRAGRLFRALRFTFVDGKISQIEVIADSSRLDELELSVVNE